MLTNASAWPWQLPLPRDTLKCKYFSPSSATNSHHSSPSLISHLMPALTFNVFIPPVKALHILLFPYLHSYSSFSVLDLCGPARRSTTSATGSFAIAYTGPNQGLEIDTLPCFFHTQNPTDLRKLGAALTIKSINLTCKIYASKTELLCTDQPLRNLNLCFWGKIYTRYKLGSYLLRFAISLSFLINFPPCSFLSFACSDFADNAYLNDYWSKQCKQMCRANIKCGFLLASMYPSSFKHLCFQLKTLLYTWTFKGSQSAVLGTKVSHGTSICPLIGWHKKCKNLIYGLYICKEKILSIQFILQR